MQRQRGELVPVAEALAARSGASQRGRETRWLQAVRRNNVLTIVFIIITFLLAYTCGTGPDAPSKERRLLDIEQRLVDEIAKYKTSPCNTALRFEKKSSGWVLTCPGCKLAARRYFFLSTDHQSD